MTLIAWTILGTAAVLGIWVGILYLFAKADKPHLENEHIGRVFGDGASSAAVKDSDNG